jgi:hypothetical protein
MAEVKDKKHNFSGYATKYDVLCSDGRTIKKNAFSHNDGQKIPLVWQHMHNDPTNILGHAILEHREDGVYAYGYFNDSASGKQGQTLVEHGDIGSMSIFANKLVEKSNLVHSGQIRELSLVLSGANPGAVIEHITLSHSDGEDTISEEEAIVSMNIPLDTITKEQGIKHAEDEETVSDVVDSMNDKQKKIMFALIAQALEAEETGDDDGEVKQSDDKQGDKVMKQNVFDKTDEEDKALTHAQIEEFAGVVFADVENKKFKTFKESFVAHAGTYGIDNISYLFPDAKALDSEPGFDTRRMSWVTGWMSQTRHTPFSRIKKLWADLTPDVARAKGYITGNEKVEQVFAILKRTTEPTTVYKKQKLDRDDISDITDFNVVTWMWREMRFMLDEEVARAALVGDGRSFGVDDDAIDPSKIRPIFGDVAQFVHYLTLLDTVVDYLDIMDAINTARVNYKGTGIPNLYTTNAVLNGMLLLRDTTNRRLFKSVAELASELRVADIIEVPVMEGVQRINVSPAFTADLLAIMVNPHDYTYGADAGGKVSNYDQFDIDFNQQKYLIEARMSGSLLEPKSAMVIERETA